MNGRIELGAVWGIPVRIHVSWFFVFVLISWSLAARHFPAEHVGWPALAYWIAGAATALLLFASVVVHELGHARVALRHGLPIRGITLFIFGGLAQIGREPTSPGVELRIAVAGPLTSLGLAVAFALAALVTRPVEVVAVPALWLARINTVIALFNLVPGFPLDGGRVLRAIVWWWTGQFRYASRVAANAGQLVALAFIGLGILMVLRGAVLDGVWIMFIGWFLQNAAAASAADADLRGRMQDATVARAMSTEPRRVPGDVTLERLVHDEVLGAGRRCFAVMDGGRLGGLLTLHDIKNVPRDRWGEVTAAHAMTAAEKLVSVAPNDSMLAALEKMDEAEVAQLPVLEGATLVGFIGREHVLRYVRARVELGI